MSQMVQVFERRHGETLRTLIRPAKAPKHEIAANSITDARSNALQSPFMLSGKCECAAYLRGSA
jgi:hypothetical protein